MLLGWATRRGSIVLGAPADALGEIETDPQGLGHLHPDIPVCVH